MQKELKALKNKKAAVVSAAIAILLIIFACVGREFLRGKGYYYPMAVLIIALSLLPFLVSFEKRRPSSREIVILACMSALAVASRAAFYALPTVKPMCAIVIVTAVCFGPQTGFICGVLSMFVSNFIFGQGMWTPFQMLGMGIAGLVAGAMFYNRKINKWVLSITGGVLAFALYGVIVDISSVLMMATDFSLKQITTIYLSGFAFNLSHGITTFVVLLLAGDIFIEKLNRIKTKYGLFE